MAEYGDEWVSGSSDASFDELEEEREGDEIAEERERDEVAEERESDEVAEERESGGKKKEGKRKRKRHAAEVVAADTILSLSKKSDHHAKKKKKKRRHRDVVVDESNSKKRRRPLPFERIWKVEDEHLLFKLMADFKRSTDLEPSVKTPAFMEFLSVNEGPFVNKMSKEQVFNKIRSSKRKLRNYYLKKNNNVTPSFQTPIQKELFHLLNAIWPSAAAAGNGNSNEKKKGDEYDVVSMCVLEEWFVEGVRNVESKEERIQLESKWSKYKQRFDKTRLKLLQLVTSVSTTTPSHRSSS